MNSNYAIIKKLIGLQGIKVTYFDVNKWYM